MLHSVQSSRWQGGENFKKRGRKSNALAPKCQITHWPRQSLHYPPWACPHNKTTHLDVPFVGCVEVFSSFRGDWKQITMPLQNNLAFWRQRIQLPASFFEVFPTLPPAWLDTMEHMYITIYVFRTSQMSNHSEFDTCICFLLRLYFMLCSVLRGICCYLVCIQKGFWALNV